MSAYAAKTQVPVSRTRAHIEELLTDYEADSIGVLMEKTRATVVFRIRGWGVRIRISMPSPEDFPVVGLAGKDKNGMRKRRPATPEESRARADQEGKAKWRALFLTLKAKLVSVDEGVETFEEAFLPHLVLPGGTTVMDGCRGKLTPGKELPQLGSGEDVPQLGSGE